MQQSNIRRLATCAVMLALSVVLAMFAVFQLPQGGSVTVASMAPIILISFKYELKWGMITALAYSALQMVLPPGFYAPPTETFGYYLLVVLLDYVVAFSVLGLAGFIGKPFKNRVASAMVGSGAAVFLRFACHFLSGILIWDVYAPEGQPVWLYSLTYNGSYMLVEGVITAVVMGVLAAAIPQHVFSKDRLVKFKQAARA